MFFSKHFQAFSKNFEQLIFSIIEQNCLLRDLENSDFLLMFENLNWLTDLTDSDNLVKKLEYSPIYKFLHKWRVFEFF